MIKLVSESRLKDIMGKEGNKQVKAYKTPKEFKAALQNIAKNVKGPYGQIASELAASVDGMC